MAPERVGHARVKTETLVAFRSALAAGGLGCEAFGDGMAVRIDESTVYEPDATIRCGPRVPNDAVLLDDPRGRCRGESPVEPGIDAGNEARGLLPLSSVRHYLVLQPETRRVIISTAEAGRIVTRILGEDATRRSSRRGSR